MTLHEGDRPKNLAPISGLVTSRPPLAVNVALGGGGVKALSHIGVLQALTELGIEVRSIVGTSAGALIGAVFAYYRARETNRGERHLLKAQARAVKATERLFVRQSFLSLADITWWSLTEKGVLAGKTLEQWLKFRLLAPDGRSGITFGDLDFDLTVTATDSRTGLCLELNKDTDKGRQVEVFRAVRASLSFQLVLHDAPLNFGDTEIHCWDGGTTGNCRFDLAYRRDPRLLTVGSSLTYAGETTITNVHKLISLLRLGLVTLHTVSIMQRQMEAIMESLIPGGSIYLVRPECDNVGVFSLWIGKARRQRIIDSGYASAISSFTRIMWHESLT